MKKKALSLLLTLAMCLTLAPTAALAEESRSAEPAPELEQTASAHGTQAGTGAETETGTGSEAETEAGPETAAEPALLSAQGAAVQAANTAAVGTFDELKAAVENAAVSVITVTAEDIEVGETLTVDRSLTIRTDDTASAANQTARHLVRKDGFTGTLLEITGGEAVFENLIISGAYRTGHRAPVTVASDASLTMDNSAVRSFLTVQDNINTTFRGSAVYVEGALTMTNGSRIDDKRTLGETSVQGGGVCLLGGTLELKNGSRILNNRACVSTAAAFTSGWGGVFGGGVCAFTANYRRASILVGVNNDEGNTEQSVIAQNKALARTDVEDYRTSIASGDNGGMGGGVYIVGDITVGEYGKIEGNEADFAGGGVCVMGQGCTLSLEGGRITGNMIENPADTASAVNVKGAGVYSNTGTVSISAGSIDGNGVMSGNGSAMGGGVYLVNGTMDMTGGSIAGNRAIAEDGSSFGGGVCVSNTDLTVAGGSITGNSVRADDSRDALGGGVYCANSSSRKLTVSGAPQITGNTVGGNAASGGRPSNVYLPAGGTVTVGGGGLTDGACIGVTTETEVTGYPGVDIAQNASAGDAKYFSDDRTGMRGEYNGVHGGLYFDKAAHQHCRCALSLRTGGAAHLEACPEADETWTAVYSLSDLNGMKANGYYYLANDIDVKDYRNRNGFTGPAENVRLCLNGRRLYISTDSMTGSDLIKVGGAFALTDCAPESETGSVTPAGGGGTGVNVNDGGNFTLCGGAISGFNEGVFCSGTFRMYGGTITGCEDYGVRTFAGGTAEISGGTISGNSRYGVLNNGTTTLRGTVRVTGNGTNRSGSLPQSGVYNNNSAVLTVGGGVQITGNTDVSGRPANVDRNYSKIMFDGAPESGASIGIFGKDLDSDTVSDSGYALWKDHIRPDDSAAYELTTDGSDAIILVKLSKQPQTLSFDQNAAAKTYGDPSFRIPVRHIGDGTVTYSSDNERVAAVDQNTGTVTVKGAGAAVITAAASATENYAAAAASYTLTVAKGTITVTAKDRKAQVGDPAPALGEDAYTVAGLAAGETLKTKPAVAYAGTPDMTRAGVTEITVSGAEAPDGGNYNEIRYVSGKLTVTARSAGGGSDSSDSSDGYPVTAPGAEHGSVTAAPGNAAKGDTVTVTVKPDSGYQLSRLTVTDRQGNELKLTDMGGGQYRFTMPAGQVNVKASFIKESETAPFSDVSAGAYYYDAVKWAAEAGITGGTGGGAFGPNQPCTRAQIVTFLWRAAGSPEPKNAQTTLSDVPESAYYAKAVAWAVENGVTSGTKDGRFAPGAPCTRAQSVAFLYRASGSPAADGGAGFGDVADGAYYAAAVAWAQANGITGGLGNGLFGPGSGCTRAQIVTFLWRLYAGGQTK